MLPTMLAAGFFAEWAQAWAANIGGIILVVVGMILIVVEMIIPGFGAAGISGGIAVVAGLIIGSNTITGAMFSLLIIVALLAVIATVIFRSALKGKLSRSPVVLNTAIEAESTSLSGDEMKSIVGRRGRTVTALRPSGIAIIDGRRIDVCSEAEFIERGEEIEVESTDGMRVLVKRA